MTDILTVLESEILIFYFGMANTYQSLGWDMKSPMELWNIEHPDLAHRAIQECIDAGCHIMPGPGLTNRYRAAPFGLEDKVPDIVCRAMKIARQATPEHLYLAGVTSVTGRFLEPVGDATVEEFYEAQKEVVLALAEGGADLICFITMNDIEESVTAVKAAKDNCDLPVLVAMAFDRTPKGCRTNMGVDPTTAARRLVEAGADIIGSNCGSSGVEDNTEIVKEMRAATDTFIMVRPNAGIPQQTADEESVWPAGPEEFAAQAPLWVAAGANIVGGCCGTTAEHTRQMVATMKQHGIKIRSTGA
jgi:5-methyltetrahydrofolate--homocysteine methyltransferase